MKALGELGIGTPGLLIKEEIMENFISREEHREFVERIDERDKTQDRRISELEATVKEIGRLTISVEKMASSMEHMATEQKKTSERLDKIEEKPQKRVETVITEIIKYAVVFALGALIMRFGVTI